MPERRPGVPGALRLGEAAAVLGGYRWMERRLFELTGAWAAAAVPPELALYLDEVSAQHAWHAALWEDRLPVLDGVDRDALTRPHGPAVDAVFEALAGSAPADRSRSDAATGTDRVGAVRCLAGLCRVVLPRLLVTYAEHRARATTATDGPTMRALGLVTADETAAWQAGEAILQRLLADAGLVAEAAGTQQRLETVLAGSGIAGGLVTWPGNGAGDRST